MKKLALIVLMAMVLAPAVVFAWSENYSLMSDEDMKKAVCRTAIRLNFEVITSHDSWAGLQTEVRPAQVDLFPEPAQVRQFRVGVGTELAQIFPVNATITHIPYPEYSVEKGGPMVMESAAGISTFSGSTMIRQGGGMYLQVR